MVRKKLAVVLAALGTMHTGVVSALGLGDFSLNSALNEPLDAEIKLTDTIDLDESQLIVRLATAEDFSTAGVAREFFLTNLKFKVILNEDGTGVIKVTSSESVLEPYLDFLVEARWPNGRLLREYTVLLDLPVYSKSEPLAVQSATVEQPAAPAPSPTKSVPTVVSTAPVLASESSRQTLNQGELLAGSEYRVRQSDTLWEIAAKARPNKQASIQQTMLAVQRLNPNAFINGNINNLKAGYVLRLPTQDQTQEMSNQAAINQVASQNQQWKTGETTASSDDGAQLDATASQPSSAGDADAGARLSLGSGGSSAANSVGDGEGVNAEGIQALQDELDRAKEGLDQTGRENEELQSRLQDMEARIATLQRLLELKDDQLASMQAGADVSEELSSEAGVEEAAETAELAEQELADEQEQAQLEESVEEDFAEDQSAELETLADEEAMTATEEAPADESFAGEMEEPGLVDRILANPLYAGAGLLVLVLIALLFMRRKKSADDEDDFEDDINSEILAFEDAQEPEDDNTDNIESAVDEDIAGGDFNVGDFSIDQDEVELEQPADEEPSAKPETGDAIAEADIYIAYGRYQQAIDLLTAAIDQEPQRSDLQVKLMEVYLETRDKPGFQQQYSSLLALGDDASVVQVKEMLSSVDGVSDWLDGVATEQAAITDEDMDAELIEGEEQDLQLDDAEIDLDLDPDLDLDLEAEGDLTQEFAAADLEVADSEIELDLELDDDSLTDISGGDTIQFDAVDLEGGADSVELDDLEIEDFQLEDSDDLDLVLDGDDDLTTENTVGEPDAPKPTAPPEEIASQDEGFDLDLDSDFDLDLDDLSGDTDLGDLEAEFDGASGSTEAAAAEEPEAKPEVEIDTDAMDAVDIGADDLEFSAELDAPELNLDADNTETESQPNQTAAPEASLAEAATDEGEEEEFDFLGDSDEVATKLDLARAYIDMGDTEGAKDILDEVSQEGNDEQKQEASELLARID